MNKTIAVLLSFVMAFAISTDLLAKKRTKKKTVQSQGLGASTTPKNTVTKKEKAQFKHFNENNPKTASDNTITVVKNGEEVEMPVKETWNEKHLKFFEGQTVSVMSSYNPETGDYTVTGIEPFNNQW